MLKKSCAELEQITLSLYLLGNFEKNYDVSKIQIKPYFSKNIFNVFNQNLYYKVGQNLTMGPVYWS